VEEAQWCSAGALARRLGMDAAACRSLLEALEAGGYLKEPYCGRLPERYRSEWLPGEESGDEPLLLWHLSYPRGKSLAKARIGPPVPRAVAEGLVRDVLARVIGVNRDPASTHVITRVALFGSMTDPSRELVSDVDLAVWADRRSDASLGAGPELLLEGKLIASRRIWRHATVPGWRRCSRLTTSGSMSAWLMAGPRQHPPSRPARRRSSCSRTSHQRPAGLTQHRVGDPGSPRHGGGGTVRDPGRDQRRLGAGRPARGVPRPGRPRDAGGYRSLPSHHDQMAKPSLLSTRYRR
jgi:hypothetical protein